MTTGGDRRFIVLGGCGAIGRVVVRDLFESNRRNRILIADYNATAAREYAKSFRSRRVRAAFADAGRPAMLAKLFRGHAAVINCTQHDFNLRVMRAALRARIHYVDLGGLFHWTRRQLRLHRPFQRAGLTAVIGMGCAPGITNVMARAAIERLGGRARSVKIRVGSRDLSAEPLSEFRATYVARNSDGAGLAFPYSAQTIVEELTLRPWVFSGGKFRQVKPRSGWERVRFPKPVGTQWVVRTRHSEVATLPVSFRLRDCDFKVGFERRFVRELMRRLQRGWTVRDFAKLPAPRNRPDDYEIARVIVTARRGDAAPPTTITMDCHARAKPKWRASAGDVDTGCPPSIVAQMIASGQITQRGVLPPEVAVPVEPFFRQLRKRGMRIEVRR